MHRLLPGTALLSLAALTGCHSHYIQATINNNSSNEIDVIQVDNPSASFGVQTLAPHASFHYGFKLLGSGPVKVSYVDANKGDHSITGPHLNEGQEGPLTINLTQSAATFESQLKP